MAQIAASPTLAKTCEARRPSPRSAVPSRCLRERPNRVAAQVSAKTDSSVAKAHGPAAANRARQTTAPATAPDRVTPRTRCPRAANNSVMARTTPKRVGVPAHQGRAISIKPSVMSGIASEPQFFMALRRGNQTCKLQPLGAEFRRTHPIVLFLSITPQGCCIQKVIACATLSTLGAALAPSRVLR